MKEIANDGLAAFSLRGVARRAARFVEDRPGLEVTIGLALGQSRVAKLIGRDAFRRAVG